MKIAQACWMPLQELAEISEIHSLTISPYLNELAKHLLNECQKSYSCKLPDHRQILKRGDLTDTMHVEFLHQDVINRL
ncbi:MAG: hypothetical protein ACH350_05180 [Parachlamydiaceae bacterium]